jgi:hypothetical protein
MQNYTTVTDAIADLQKRGYDHDFNITEGCLYCNQVSLEPSDFAIDEIHRFEGQTDPDDQMILYAIASRKHSLKGTLVNAYGMYADTQVDELVSRLKSKEHL